MLHFAPEIDKGNDNVDRVNVSGEWSVDEMWTPIAYA